MISLSGKIFKTSMRKAVADLGYRIPPEQAASIGTWDIKSLMLGGHTDITLLQNDTFVAEFDPERYFEALRFSMYRGYTRALKQTTAAKSISQVISVPTPWVVVSSYYAAFFTAVELLRAAGVWFTFLDKADVSTVTASATNTPPVSLSPGLYLGRTSRANSGDSHRIRFARESGSSHQHIWQQLGHVLLARVSPNDTQEQFELDMFSRFLGHGKRSWNNPSETRNEWNYQRPELYGICGDREGLEFRKIVKTPKSASAWASNKHMGRSGSTEAAAIAFVMFVLQDVFDQTKNIIFPSSILVRLSQYN
ncbi:MAG: hypothetical protein PHR77_12400 [Kiritimatiellae bacterium]|nr:hypothetical protein [Kiritimatiellia bacterium]MDD5519511.1 hypothetical protein [Kiritimatiellia bacterium]